MIQRMRADEADWSAIRTDEIFRDERIEAVVAEILEDVRHRGDAALREYALRFDKAALDNLRVTPEETDAALKSVDADFLRLMERAKERIASFHRRQVRAGFVIAEEDGIVLGQRVTPIEKAGLYVPGGTALYPSSVLMNAVPAQIAGVARIVLITPPRPDGTISPNILAAAHIAGVTEIYKSGGAQAIAALAYGTETIPRVDKIVGPGNIYVATAKRRVYGLVDIDMIAGPSEILVIADAACNARQVAADLLSQAEHDRLASAILLTDSEALAEAVSLELERQIPLLPRREIARASIDERGKIILVDNLDQAVALANRIAPEHLELCVDEPFALLSQVRNAGSIFLGKNAPEALGDYWAGPNHTLPTGGAARFSSPLSVDDFVKKSSYTYYARDALCEAKDSIAAFARREGLEAHARSVLARFED